MAPDKIYLAWEYSKIDTLPPGVTAKQVFGKDVCYIRKDALLEWAKENEKRLGDLLTLTNPSLVIGGKLYAYQDFIDKIESL